MRDPKRIDRILALVREQWARNPDLRLMQLLGNAHGLNHDPYYYEDDKLEADLRRDTDAKGAR